MTPEDVAAIRAENAAHGSMRQCHEVALCDALEQAWAERDLVLELGHPDPVVMASLLTAFRMERERAEKAEDALDRVRENCARPPGTCYEEVQP